MVKSMTGFGRGRVTDDVKTVTVELKAVNHRYCEIYVKLPRKLSYAEEAIKSEIRKRLVRGKIEVTVTVDNFGVSDSDIKLDIDLAEKYYSALKELGKHFEIDSAGGGISLSLMSRMPDVITAVPAQENEEEMKKCLIEATDRALDDICEMRRTEGEKLAEDILARADIIESIRQRIEERAPELEAEYAQRMRTRIGELLDGAVEIPEDRIALEAAVFADKANITEELVRLESHVLQLKNFLKSDDSAIGKKIDFLIQEMNREANTIGSKSNDGDITNMMLELKAEIEKIREQVQNIE